MTYRVFVSYSSRNLDVVERAQDLWEGDGVRVFVAEHSVAPGEPLGDSIADGIRKSDLFVLFWSRYAEDSDWIPQEIGIAKEAGKQIIPVVLDEGTEPPAFIRDLKYLPAHDGTEQALRAIRDDVQGRARWKRRKAEWIRIGFSFLSLIPTGIEIWRDLRGKSEKQDQEGS